MNKDYTTAQPGKNKSVEGVLLLIVFLIGAIGFLCTYGKSQQHAATDVDERPVKEMSATQRPTGPGTY